ncbi:MAG TPA: amidohydrolase family protein [Steroidobacteraceae bacterium]|jgi:2,3-dihydroxybenzoate decarboxylase
MTSVPAAKGYKRIATEEAFAPPELFARYRQLLERGGCDDPGFQSLWGFYLSSPSPRATQIIARIQDLGEQRLRDMDATGIDRQILSLTSPGVQVFDAATATALARSFNDQLSDAIREHPDRYSGLTAVAPQDPQQAAKEIERGATQLGLKGVIINSHTLGEYLDDEKYWDIFAAAEAFNAPIYIHPNTPSRGLVGPLLERGLEGAIYGFAVDTGMHLLAIITSGAFDRFPGLRIVVGHTGEALPFWMYRIDYMHRASVAAGRYPRMKALRKRPSDYLRENVYVTNSGVGWEPAILFCISVLGADRVMYAMDYPYQYVAEEVITCDNLALSDIDKRKFFQLNAERVFSLC